MAKFNIHIGDAGEGIQIIGADSLDVRLNKGAWDFAVRVSESLGIADHENGQLLPADDDVIFARIEELVRANAEIERLRNEQIGVNADLVICKRELATSRRALESLTPGGSEFSGNPERCVEFVRERRARLNPSVEYCEGRAVGCGEDEIDRLTAENAALREGAKRGEAAIAKIHSKYQSQFAALASLRTKVNALLSEIDESQDRLLIEHRLSETLPALREEVAK